MAKKESDGLMIAGGVALLVAGIIVLVVIMSKKSGGATPAPAAAKCTGLLDGEWCGGSGCGTIGGSGCSGRPGGSAECCTGTIGATGRICNGTTITTLCRMPAVEPFATYSKIKRITQREPGKIVLYILGAWAIYRIFKKQKVIPKNPIVPQLI